MEDVYRYDLNNFLKDCRMRLFNKAAAAPAPPYQR
jgi:hypothetical protein